MATKDSPQRRGLAMMLVLVSVAMATILASAYLFSRDNSLAIARNNSASARARYAAYSGLQTAVAILQTDTNWRTSHTGGVLLDSYPLAGADVTITAYDIEKGSVPNAWSEYVKVTATAEVDLNGDGGAESRQQTTFLAYVPMVTIERAAVDLAEFAVFVDDDLTMSGTSTIARWPKAPLTKLGRRVYLGTRSTGSGSIDIRDDAACIDCTLHHYASASSSLLNDTSGPEVTKKDHPFQIPFPQPPDSELASPPITSTDYDVIGSTDTLTASDRFDDVFLDNGATVTLVGDISLVADEDFQLFDGSRMVIDGNVTLGAFLDFEVQSGSSIELRPGATLKIFVGDDFRVVDGFIGEEGGVTDATGEAAYMDPLRVQVYSIEATGVPDRVWKLDGNSVVKGTLYGNTAEFRVLSSSALYGRVAAQDVIMSTDGAIFYDHTLDERVGFTNPESPLYDVTGNFDADYSTLITLDTAVLQAVANLSATVIHARGLTIYPVPAPPGPPPPGAGEPTPRHVPVEFLITRIGPNMDRWERPDDFTEAGGGGGGGGGEELTF